MTARKNAGSQQGQTFKLNRGRMRRRHPIGSSLMTDIQPLTDNQKKIIDAWDSGKHLFIYGMAGSGKAQPLYSKILTPNGWITMGEIQIGDEVCTPKNTTSKVIGVFPQGVKSIYEITFHDGSKTRACADHLWEVNAPNDWHRSKSGSKKIMTTQDIINFLREKETRKSRTNISIDLIEPIQTENIELPLDPYFLGCLLGDGCLTTSTPKITSADNEIINSLQDIIGEEYILKFVKSSKFDYNITDTKARKNRYNRITKILTELNIQGKKSYEKKIPQIYMNSGTEQKIKLLQGLLDTDGYVCSKQGQISFSSSSEILSKQVQEIVWSLGGISNIRSRIPTYHYDGEKRNGRRNYEVSISIRNPKDFFRLQRKIDRCKNDFDKLQYRRKIKSVNYIGEDTAQCIMIDDPHHLYITDDYIITHNTFVALYKALYDCLKDTPLYESVYIVRSLVATREIGFLPGDHEDKSSLYQIPYKQMVKYMFELTSDEAFDSLYENLKAQETIKFWSTSFLRGVTLDNTVILVDELENLSGHELDSIITRVGKNTRMVFCGDIMQSDLVKQSERNGVHDFMRILNLMPDDFEMIEMGIDDIVRSGLVKNYIIAKTQLGITYF